MVVVRDTGVFVAALSLLFLILLLSAALLDQWAPLRTLGILVALPAVALYGLHLTLALRRIRHEVGLARLVGHRCPSLRSDLLSTVELGLQLESSTGGAEERGRFSTELYEALARQTWRRLSRLAARSLVSPAMLQPTAILLTISVLAWATAAATLPSQVQRGASRLLLTSTGADGEVATTLLVGDLTLRLHYPQHMARPDRSVQSSTGHITAPRGTRVRIAATTLAPLAAPAALLLRWRGQSPERRPLDLDQQQLRGELVVTGASDGSYRFQVHSPDGRLLVDPIVRRIHVEPDAPPRITLYGPKSDLMVTMQHRLEIGYTAEDDHGVTRVDLVYQIGSLPPQRKTLWTPRRKPADSARKRSAAGKHDWDLGGLDLFAGARVAYWVEATDNDTVSGPKTGRSTALYFKVYSAEEKHRETLAQHEALVELAIRLLADRLLLYEAEPATAANLRLTKHLEVNRSNGSLVDGLRELRNRMRQDGMAPRTLLRAVSRMHQRMNASVRAETAALRAADAVRRRNPSRPVALDPLVEQNRKLVAELERDVLRLSDLLDEQRLQSLRSLARNLEGARRRLADLLRRYRKSRSEALRQQLLRQIQRMEQQLNELMTRMAKLGSSIPDEYLNAEALKDLDLRSELRKLAEQVRSGQLQDLEASLRALDRKLGELDSMLAGNLDQYRNSRMSARERAFSAMLDRLRGLESEQRRVAGRTRRIIRRYQQRASQMMKHRITPFVRRELGKLQRLRKRVNEIDPAALPAYDQEQLERIRQRVRDLKGMLEQGDLDEALRMALRTRNGLEVLQDDLAEEVEGQHPRRRGQMRKAQRKTRLAGKLAGELVADLRGIFPSPRALLDNDDRKQLRRLLGEQRGLQRKLQQLETQLEKETRHAAMFGGELPQALKESSGLMGKASSKLGSLQPQEAHGSQEAAADRLARLRQQMEEARQPRHWSQAGPSVLRERIHIPGADAFRPPREFRKDILDAMKEKAPRAFQGQVNRYYEELVR